jgi:hypothetical protein
LRKWVRTSAGFHDPNRWHATCFNVRIMRPIIALALCLAATACSPAAGNKPSFGPVESWDDGDEDNGDEEGEVGGGGSGSQGGSTGKGGNTSQNTGGTGGSKSGTGGAAPGSGGEQTSGGSGGAAFGGSSGAPASCSYPTAGYGTNPGNVVASSTQWNGYAPGAGTTSNISIESFLDCDGTQGINALLIVYGAGWCSACQEEAALLPGLMQTWGPAGIVVVELLVETSSGSPATSQTAKAWRDAFQLTSSYVAADPDFQLESAAADTFPYKVLVDPRTMKIVATDMGGTSDDAVMQLAQKNQ